MLTTVSILETISLQSYILILFLGLFMTIRGKLQQKKMFFLHEHLHSAIMSGKILSRYSPVLSQRVNETPKQYIKRLAQAAATYQFVSVETTTGIKYVSFGVPGPIITDFGEFLVIPAEVVGGTWGIHYFMIHPELESLLNKKVVTLRIDSGCFSGMVLGDVTCDCLHQLRDAQKLCIKKGAGIVIEIPGHDGRGWGEYKMANQKIMKELNYNTIKAAENFYGSKSIIDARTYNEATIILKALGFTSEQEFDLATKNPFKIQAFLQSGFKIASVKPVHHKVINRKARKNVAAKAKYWKELRTNLDTPSFRRKNVQVQE